MSEKQPSRYGLSGDFPTRVMVFLLKITTHLPAFIEAALFYPIVLILFLLAREQRNAVRDNLRVIHSDLAWFESYARAYLVFCNFGWTYADALRTQLGQDIVTWELEGEEHFLKIKNSKEATILFTTHTGNYDLAAALFASKFNRTLHTVRAPEKTQELQELRKKQLQDQAKENPLFKIHYNDSENLLGIELASLLSQGELLAIQCDRVIADVVALEVPIPKTDHNLRIPKGPMTLSCITKAPCYPLYVVRDRRRHYRIIFEAPLEPKPAPGQRKIRELDLATPWANRLMNFLEHNSEKWFVFENAFTKKS